MIGEQDGRLALLRELHLHFYAAKPPQMGRKMKIRFSPVPRASSFPVSGFKSCPLARHEAEKAGNFFSVAGRSSANAAGG
jgi:hypothetical protein